MHLLFVDESGTPSKPNNPNQSYFVIAGLVIPEDRWNGMREKLVGLKVASVTIHQAGVRYEIVETERAGARRARSRNRGGMADHATAVCGSIAS